MPQLGVVGVAGAGNMGAGIALLCAREGLAVVLLDQNSAALETALARLPHLLAEAPSPAPVEDVVLGRITPTTLPADLAACQLVIEAIHEDRAVKREFLRQAGELLPAETVIATNTGSFLVAELAEEVAHPERFLGLHFFSPPVKNRLLEMIPGAATQPAVLEACQRFAARIDKDPILVGDRPGFCVNRFFLPWLQQAVRLVEEGLSPASVEASARDIFGLAQGPLARLNASGAGAALAAARNLAERLGPFYAPAASLEERTAAGRPFDLRGEGDAAQRAEAAARLMGTVFLACGQLLDEGVAGPSEVETGARLGLGWGKGPITLMNAQGSQRAGELALAAARPHPSLGLPRALSAKEGVWRLPPLNLKVEGEIAYLTLIRPETLNVWGPALLDHLVDACEAAETDPAVKVIVLEGRGEAFSAGIDPAFVADLLARGDRAAVLEFAKRGQELLGRLQQSGKWVVALLEGAARGAGAELALACHTIVASPRATLAFPETGLGLYPALGGAQRLARYLEPALAKYLVLTGVTLRAEQARQLGLVEYLTPPGRGRAAIRDLAGRQSRLGKRPPTPLPPTGEWAAIAGLFGDPVGLEPLLEGQAPAESGELGVRLARLLARKAPIALRWASELLDQGAKLPLDKALRLEQNRLAAILETKDAREGIRAVLEGRRPVFRGA